MKRNSEERTIALNEYIAETRATVSNAAMRFGIRRSKVHKDLTQRLKRQNRALCNNVQTVLQLNKDECHLRGGEATRRQYHSNVE